MDINKEGLKAAEMRVLQSIEGKIRLNRIRNTEIGEQLIRPLHAGA